jgi:glycosyltransferase involved in cell wall biosynthesis
MDVTVIVPTYKRPDDLRRCLDALKQQTKAPARVVVVRRDVDAATVAMLTAYDAASLPMVIRVVTAPGVVAALNEGLEAATGDIVAMTDDDAAPHPDWLERIAGHFLVNARVGGVGGRDHIFQGERRDDWPPKHASASAPGMAAPTATTMPASVRRVRSSRSRASAWPSAAPPLGRCASTAACAGKAHRSPTNTCSAAPSAAPAGS